MPPRPPAATATAAHHAHRGGGPTLTTAVVGDLDARRVLDRIYVEHHVWAVRLAVQLTGDQQAAEDLVADVFVKLFRRLEAGASIDNPKAYLRTAIVHQRNSWFRRSFLERAVAGRRHADDRGHLTDTGELALRDEVLRGLDRLTGRQRQVLVLRYYEDLSVEETARVLGLATGTVKTTSHRALARLEDLLGAGR